MGIEEVVNKFSILLLECCDEEDTILDKNTDLFSDANLDSIGVFRLIVMVEEEFGIKFDDADLLSENFSKVGDFCRLIQKQILKREKRQVVNC